MKKLLVSIVAGAAAVACLGQAYAADLGYPAYKAPPPVAPVQSWTGLYIGANGGWGWSNINVSETPFGTTGIADILAGSYSTSAKGGLFGGQLGYNWQAGNFVLGIEGDYDGASINGSQQGVFPSILAPSGNTNGFMVHENINSLATIRGRIGYTWGPGLLYFTGGGAWENVQANGIISANTGPSVYGNSATGSFSTTKSGYVVGAGFEWMVAQNWTVRAEYLYYDFNGGGTNYQLGLANCAVANCGVNVTSASNNISAFRLGANYKFDWFR
jgi:outer membrane immunogenic protein